MIHIVHYLKEIKRVGSVIIVIPQTALKECSMNHRISGTRIEMKLRGPLITPKFIS